MSEAGEKEHFPATLGTNPEPVVISSRQGMFGVSDGGDTSGYGGLVAPVLLPAAALRPYGGYFDEVAERLERALVGGSASYAQAIERVVIDRGEMTLFVAREHLVGVARALRDDPSLRFEMCTGVSGVHYPHESGRELHAVCGCLTVQAAKRYNNRNNKQHDGLAQLHREIAGSDKHPRSVFTGFDRVELRKVGKCGQRQYIGD